MFNKKRFDVAAYKLESALENAMDSLHDMEDSAPETGEATLLMALAYACRTDPNETEISRISFDYGKMKEAIRKGEGEYDEVVKTIQKCLERDDWSTVNATE